MGIAMRSAGRIWSATALGLTVLAGTGTATFAADLGGACCADLEERVAELEATTARKSGKVVSLTVSGHVDRALLWYDDGSMRGFRTVDNNNSSSRFRLQGNAQVAPGLIAGYYIEFEFTDANSFGVDQIDARRAGPPIAGAAGTAQPNGHGNSPFVIGIRQSHWYLKSDTLGTLSVGRLNNASKDMVVTDLGGIGIIANGDLRLNGSEMFMRRAGTTGREGLCANGLGCTSTLRWSALTPGIDSFRIDGVRYDSPTLMGFTLSAAIGDDVRWDVALRFAQSWNGIKVAAAAGYLEDYDEQSFDTEPFGPFTLKTGSRNQHETRLVGTILHEASGLFLDGWYINRSFHGTAASDVTVGRFTAAGSQRPDFNEWWVAGGVKRNWFGPGTTSVYGEYGHGADALNGGALNTISQQPGAPGGVNLLEVTRSDVDVWGVGAVQFIDKAAMELYVGYRHSAAHIEGCGSAASCTGKITTKQAFDDLQVVMAGARIKF